MARQRTPLNLSSPLQAAWLSAAASILCISLSLPAQAQLEGTYQVIVKKQDEKKKARWTLADWLAYKEVAKAQDIWLAKNSHSSLFEFFLEASSCSCARYQEPTPDTRTSGNTFAGTIAAYAGPVGLRGSYDALSENITLTSGSFNIRLLGRAIQDTHLNIELGVRGYSLQNASHENFQNQYGAVQTAIYFGKTFGIEGGYAQMLKAESNLGRSLDSTRSEGGIFIEFEALHIFGRWQKELFRFTNSGAATVDVREGFGGGIKLFF